MLVANMRTGTRVAKRSFHRLVVGHFPPEFRQVKINGLQYRRDLEVACESRHGEVSIMASHRIDSAVAHEMCGGIMRWLLCHKLDGMTVQDIIAVASAIPKSKDSRNRAVESLQLEQNSRDTIAALYSYDLLGSDSEASQGPHGANGEKHADSSDAKGIDNPAEQAGAIAADAGA